MKRIILPAVGALALVAACNQPAPEAPPADDATVTPPAAPAAAAADLASYVSKAAMGDMYEIQAADLAIERSQNAGVRELAQMIKTDHTAASSHFKEIAPQAAPGAQIPATLDAAHQAKLDALRAASADAFDRTWLEQQVTAHQDALTLHRGFAGATGSPAPLADHARTVTPKIEAHLQRAQALQSGAAA